MRLFFQFILINLLMVPLSAQAIGPELPHGVVVIPLTLEAETVEAMGWQPNDEIWLEVTFLQSPDGEPVFVESAEKIWWLGDRALIMLGATGEQLPNRILNRGISWIILDDGGGRITQEPITLFPRNQRIRFSSYIDQIKSKLSGSLPGVDASYLSQVANFLAGNLANLDVTGTSYSVSGFGEVIDSSGAWTGSNLDFSQLSGGALKQLPAAPMLAGSLALGTDPTAVRVSGRYAYVTDQSEQDLKVIDVTEPTNPELVGSIILGSGAADLFVSGHFVYVVGGVAGLRIIDVTNPSAPSLAGSLPIGNSPNGIHVVGPYAYITDFSSEDLKVVNVTDPGAPTLVDSLNFGTRLAGLYVAGNHAYVLDLDDTAIKVVDISDPGSIVLVGNLTIGVSPADIYVSGRYAYVTDRNNDDIKVIDISDPTTPTQVSRFIFANTPNRIEVRGRYAYVVDSGLDKIFVVDVLDPANLTVAVEFTLGTNPRAVDISGRYAYVVDSGTDDLRIIDLAGAEINALEAHSLETGDLQVRNDMTAQGNLQVTGSATVGSGGFFSHGPVGLSGTLHLANDAIPTSSPANQVQLYAEDDAASAELRVRDEAGNITTLSPHNFSLIGTPSEPLAWSFYSENEVGKINVDMLHTVRLVEQVTGEQLVHLEQAEGNNSEWQSRSQPDRPKSYGDRLAQLEKENAALENRMDSQHQVLLKENADLRETIQRLQTWLEKYSLPPEKKLEALKP